MKLNLPDYTHRLKQGENFKEIFDPIRKKYVILTPEEWVRQNFIQYLINEIKVPKSLISVEVSLKLNNTKKRSDIVIYSNTATPILAVECKAPNVKISQETFNQLARYNLCLNVPCLIVTNGLNHYFCKYNEEIQTFVFSEKIPQYPF